MGAMQARDLDPAPADAAPIFDRAAFRLPKEEADLIDRARRFGARVLAPRAARHDRDATFPIENFRDMHGEGLLGICVPEDEGGEGASFRTYCLAAAELGRYCGATALSWNMHVCSTLWTGALADDLEMTEAERSEHNVRRSVHYRRIVNDGAIYSQPFSEGGAAAAGAAAFGTEAKPVEGGFLVSGKKIFASLSGAADYYGVLCTERTEGDAASRSSNSGRSAWSTHRSRPSSEPRSSSLVGWRPRRSGGGAWSRRRADHPGSRSSAACRSRCGTAWC